MLAGFPKWHPPFAIVPLFDRGECTRMIQQAVSSQRLMPATVMKQDGSVGVDKKACTANLAPFRAGTEVYDFVRQRVVERLDTINERYQFDLFAADDPKLIPYVSVLEYNSLEGDKFEPHVDMAGRRGVEYRKLSIVVPLNETHLYEGGRLIIDTGEKFDATSQASLGEAVVFSSLTMHGVTPMLAGVRYSLVIFLQGPRFR